MYSWLDVLLGIGCIVYLQTLIRRRLYEAETGSRLTNGSCAMSLNFNHVVLNTMPNVIVDVSLPTVGVLMTIVDLSRADFKRFLTILLDRPLLDSQCCVRTGLVANCIRLNKRWNALSKKSDVTRHHKMIFEEVRFPFRMIFDC